MGVGLWGMTAPFPSLVYRRGFGRSRVLEQQWRTVLSKIFLYSTDEGSKIGDRVEKNYSSMQENNSGLTKHREHPYLKNLDTDNNILKFILSGTCSPTGNISTGRNDESPLADEQPKEFKIRCKSVRDDASEVNQSNKIPEKENFSIRYTNVRPGLSPLVFGSKSRIDPPDEIVSPFRKNLVPSSRVTDFNILPLEELKNIDELREKVSEGNPLSENWNFFLERFKPKSRRLPIPIYLKQASADFLNMIIRHKHNNPNHDVEPSIIEIIEVFSKIDSLSIGDWADLMTILLEQASPINGQQANDKILISEIIHAWNLISKKINSSDPLCPKNARIIYEEQGLDSVFGITLFEADNNDFRKIPLVAIASFSILTQKLKFFSYQFPQISSLVKLLATIIDIPNLDIESLKSRNQSEAIKSFVFNQWSRIRLKASQIMITVRELEDNQIQKAQRIYQIKNQDLPPLNPRYEWALTPYKLFSLRSALRLKNHSRIDELWSEIVTWEASTFKFDPEPVIFENFIMAYMKLQRPSRAIEVWNLMVKKGLDPSLKTWNSIMLGCKACSDWRSSEKLWKLMISSGSKPDNLSWMARISVLMNSKQVDLGIQALDEMGRVWLEIAQNTYPKLSSEELLRVENIQGVAKPDLACINIAIDGLLKQGKREKANQVLTWAGKFGIKPNTITYNTFLRRLVRTGKNNDALLLLKRMEIRGVPADVSTFTIILDQILRHPDHHGPDQLREIIEDIFSDMEKVNIKPNLLTYGKIIYQLIRDFNPNMSPIIEEILRRMEDQNIQPSIQIFTSIMKYYCLQKPPNLEKANQIIMRGVKHVGLDRTFWDSVVTCYALMGQTEAALDVISRLSSEKTRVGWAAMRSVLEALYAKKEWTLAKGLIYDVKSIANRHDFREGTLGEAEFWKIASKLDRFDEILDI